MMISGRTSRAGSVAQQEEREREVSAQRRKGAFFHFSFTFLTPTAARFTGVHILYGGGDFFIFRLFFLHLRKAACLPVVIYCTAVVHSLCGGGAGVGSRCLNFDRDQRK